MLACLLACQEYTCMYPFFLTLFLFVCLACCLFFTVVYSAICISVSVAGTSSGRRKFVSHPVNKEEATQGGEFVRVCVLCLPHFSFFEHVIGGCAVHAWDAADTASALYASSIAYLPTF